MSPPDFKDLIGKPFQEFGRGPETYDCYGVYLEVRKRLGLPTIELGLIATALCQSISEQADATKWMFQRVSDPEPGDLVLMRGMKGWNTHVGVLVEKGRILHAADGVGVHLSELSNPLYRNNIEGYYRYHGQYLQGIKSLNPFDPGQREIRRIAFLPGITLGEVAAQLGYDGTGIVLRNGQIEAKLETPLLPGDLVHYVPDVHAEGILAIIGGITAAATATSGAITGALATVGGIMSGAMGGSIAGGAAVGTAIGKGIISIAVGMVTGTLGGLIVNSLMPSTGMGTGSPSSPTYGFGPGNNPGREGVAIPVVYGRVMNYPVIIGQYIEIGASGTYYGSVDQYVHTLLAVHEGETNNLPTAEDIWADDEPLTQLLGYEVSATDGSNTPDTTKLDKFEKLHQYRSFSKHLEQYYDETLAQTLLHFNGDNGSTTITESSGFANVYTCNATAALTTTDEFLGTACLDVTTAGDDVSCDNSTTFGLFNDVTKDWDVEIRFRQSVLTDGVICGQQRIDAGVVEYYWALIYHTGNLQFQYFKETFPGPVDTTFFDVSGAAGLIVDTWHHLRVCKYTDPATSAYTVNLFVDGVEVADGTETTAIEAPASGTYTQQIGSGYRLEAGAAVAYDAEAKIDEFRVFIGQLAYDTGGFTPPTTELDISTAENLETKGVVDEISLTFEAPYGLYTMNDNAELQEYGCPIYYAYRKVGDVVWTASYAAFTGRQREPIWRQFTLTMPERAKYELRCFRGWPPPENTRYMNTVYWIGMDEILDEFLTYPNIQTVQVSLRAQDRMSGHIPTYRVVSSRTSIEVPNFDNVGTQTVAATNPSWVAYDMLTNDLYGAGMLPTRIDETAFNTWEAWCDGAVSGYTRCKINFIFDAEYDLDNALQQVENVGRARLVTKGTSISVAVESPSTPVMLYSAGNIVSGEYSLTWLPKSERVDSVEVEYIDSELSWTRQTAIARSTGYDALTRPARVARLFIPGITTAEQAHREALFRMQMTDMLKRTIEFRAGMDAIRCVMGDIFYFQHAGNAVTIGGRLDEDCTASNIAKLDQIVNLPAATFNGNCILFVRLSDDTLFEANVTGPFDLDTDSVTIDADLTASRFDPFMIGKATGGRHEYRLIKQSRDSNQTYQLQAIEYNEDVYYHADYDAAI